MYEPLIISRLSSTVILNESNHKKVLEILLLNKKIGTVYKSFYCRNLIITWGTVMRYLQFIIEQLFEREGNS